ncbi:MAG: signal recognition particle-docking protein FtsY [Longispora sp.]|nr:signal recognition particle-docking protein FtsY [Longispora sp. (in: high G+C Gram-positive bacteria)]
MEDWVLITAVVIGVALIAGLITWWALKLHRRRTEALQGRPESGQVGTGTKIPPSQVLPTPRKEQVTPGSTGTGVAERPPPAAPTVPPTTEVTPTEVTPEVASPAPTLEPQVEAPAPEIEQPAPTAGRLVRLRARLSRSRSTLGRGLLGLLSRDKLDDEVWEEVEETLITADVGLEATVELVGRLRERTRVLGTSSATELRALLAEELVTTLDPKMDRTLRAKREGGPAVMLVVGVNGAGKTTTCGKISRVLIADGHTVLLGAADTFRAAAADQLQTWASRVGAEIVRGPAGGDPASVAFDAVKRGIETEVDTVLIDTAGRLQNKVGLMDELGKVKRVVEKHGPVDETLLILDATTGQNGLEQARVFTEVVDVTGVVLTKLDGTAKGGIVIAVQRKLGIPVKLVGLGEGPDDLAPFDPAQFVDALLGE